MNILPNHGNSQVTVEKLLQVEESKYLGVLFTRGGRDHEVDKGEVEPVPSPMVMNFE